MNEMLRLDLRFSRANYNVNPFRERKSISLNSVIAEAITASIIGTTALAYSSA
jgi:hypothetical protein